MFTKHLRRADTDNSARRAGRRHPSAAVVISSIALFAGLGGVGYAAGTIGSAQIKNNSVQGADIKNGTIKSTDIALGTRLGLKGQKGPAGNQGPAGQPGLKGDTGAPGAPGLSGLEKVTSSTGAGDSVSPKSLTVACPAGKQVVGTAFDILGGTTGVAPNQYKEVSMDQLVVQPDLSSVSFGAYEQKGGSADNWALYGTVLCATVA
jgi:hypothetical protein